MTVAFFGGASAAESYTPISVDVTPNAVNTNQGPSSQLFTANVSGGNGSHSYAWTFTGPGTFSHSPNGSTCSVSWVSSTAGDATISCFVNDGVSTDSDQSSIHVGIIQ